MHVVNKNEKVFDVAKKLCELYDAKLVLGSATPSLESFNKAEKGEYNLIEIFNKHLLVFNLLIQLTLKTISPLSVYLAALVNIFKII